MTEAVERKRLDRAQRSERLRTGFDRWRDDSECFGELAAPHAVIAERAWYSQSRQCGLGDATMAAA
jgi:hypothetical protein